MTDYSEKGTYTVGVRPNGPRRLASRKASGTAFVGLGLILVGIAVWILAADTATKDATQPTDFSSIPAKVQFAAPQLTLNDLDGRSHALEDYRGLIVLANLWATWCPPCAAEMPNLERFYRLHREEGFVVIAIEDGDPPAQVRSFVDAQQITFPIWLDPTYQATDHAFKTANLPSSYVIDRAGTVRLMWVGAINEANLEKYVMPLIKE